MRRYKIQLSLLVGLFVAFGFLVDMPSAQEAKKDLPNILRWGTLQVGASNYQESVGMAEIIKKYTPMEVKVEPTLGDLVWGPMLSKGELDFGCQSFTGPLWGYYGIGPYKDKGALKNLRLVGQGTPLNYAILTTKTTGIKKIADLRGKKVGNPVGIFYMKHILLAAIEANGMTENDVKIIDSTTAAEMKNDLISGRIDAFLWGLAPVILEIETAKGAYVIPLTKKEQANVVKKVRGLKEITAPAGLFGMPATPTVYTPGAVITRMDQRDDVVYEVVKAVYGHSAELSTYGPTLAGYHLGRALAFPALPVHPGAIKYFKEKWVWSEELEQHNNQVLAEEKKR